MNCKPGDLALVIYAARKSAIGLVVEVLNIDRPDRAYGAAWNCKAVSGARSDIGFCLPGDFCYLPDAWLRPIRPGNISDEEVRDLYAPKLPEVA